MASTSLAAYFRILELVFETVRLALEDDLARRVFLFRADAVEAVVGHRAEQTFTGGYRAAVGDAAEFSGKVEHILRQRPVKGKMAAKLSVGDEANKQRVVTNRVGRLQA